MSDGCVSKLATSSASGFCFGTLIGALNATWQVRRLPTLPRGPRAPPPPPPPRPPPPRRPLDRRARAPTHRATISITPDVPNATTFLTSVPRPDRPVPSRPRQDAPAVMRNQSWPALAKTGGMMASAGGTFAAIGGIYAGVACASEGVRGKADFWNGVVGGLAAGQVIGVRGRSLGLGVGAGACFAVASAAADAAGYKVRGEGGFDDGATPARVYFPYKN